MKDQAYVVNIDKYESIGPHSIALYVNHDKVHGTLIALEVEYIPKEIKEFIESQNSTTNVLRIQGNDSIRCR